MITKQDLNVVKTYVEEIDNTTWALVEFNKDRYILTSTNVTDKVLDDMQEKDPYLSLMHILGLPRFECAVFRGDKDWHIVGKCDDTCSNGICTKRIAQAKDVQNPTIDISFNLLIDYLNS